MPTGMFEPLFGFLKSGFDQVFSVAGPGVVAIGLLAGLMFLFRSTGIVSRTWRAIEEVMFSNWRLGLLGATGLILSMASGWTTWDGMRNFTGEPILSAMVTFGIQGVMLIVAWLIGESFATGMSQQSPKSMIDGDAVRSDFGLKGALVLTLAGVLLAAVALAVRYGSQTRLDQDQMFIVLASLGGASLVIGLLIVAARAHTLRGYFDASRVIVRTAVLWVMFLACMATSVFFSFDSLFTAIFPQSERVRAAELRAQNQVAGIIADIGETISKKRLSEADALFRGVDAAGKDNGWAAYEKNLGQLADKSQGAERIIEDHYVKQMEARRRGIVEQQERATSANSGQAGLLSRKASLTDELARLETERPSLAADYAEKKNALDARAKEVDSKRVEAMAEEKGVEGTGKVGKGPVFRQRNEELGKLQDYIKIGEERARDSKRRLDQTETRLAQIKRELAAVDGDLGKLKSEVSTAEQRIKLAEDTKNTEEGASRVDPARVRGAFEAARNEFRQEPTAERLAKVQQMCGQLYNGLASAEVTKERVRGIDCDPKSAVEAAARVFALNDGIKAFTTNCQGGDRIAQHKTADALFEFSRKCLADSGLPSRDTEQMRTRINGIELARDDKAHRFVVTWNAFQDGNRLAYLALAIAIAIDSLVFMSGLFGANAVRSPLSDVPTMKARSAEQLEAIIEAALLPDIFTKARVARRAMHPARPIDGYTHEVMLSELDPSTAANVRDVLNAGATIGAVRKEDATGHYSVRSELYEFLSEVIKRELKANKADATQSLKLNELEDRIAEALIPNVGHGAEVVLHYMHACNEKDRILERHPVQRGARGSSVASSKRPQCRVALREGSTRKGRQGSIPLRCAWRCAFGTVEPSCADHDVGCSRAAARAIRAWDAIWWRAWRELGADQRPGIDGGGSARRTSCWRAANCCA